MITMYILAGYCAGVLLAIVIIFIDVMFSLDSIGSMMILPFKKPRTLIDEGRFLATDGSKIMTSVDCLEWGSDDDESRGPNHDVEREWVSVIWTAPTYQGNGYIWDDWFKQKSGDK